MDLISERLVRDVYSKQKVWTQMWTERWQEPYNGHTWINNALQLLTSIYLFCILPIFGYFRVYSYIWRKLTFSNIFLTVSTAEISYILGESPLSFIIFRLWRVNLFINRFLMKKERVYLFFRTKFFGLGESSFL